MKCKTHGIPIKICELWAYCKKKNSKTKQKKRHKQRLPGRKNSSTQQRDRKLFFLCVAYENNANLP